MSVVYLVFSVDVTYIDFIEKHRKNENTDRSSAEDTGVPTNFNARDDDRNMYYYSDEFQKDLSLNLDIVALWTVNKSNNKF
jgi:hypothetical protein